MPAQGAFIVGSGQLLNTMAAAGSHSLLNSIPFHFKTSKMKRITVVIFLATSLSASAQQNDTMELQPVEVRAVRASNTAPFAKTNIGKSQLERQNLGQDLPFLLNQTPSVVVNSDAGNGIGYTGIRIRGTDASRINVTLNGIPYNDAESQGTFFVDLPDIASSINSLQVQRGVGTSSNGSGAFGATINVSTHEVNETPYAQFNNAYGSFNSFKNTIKAGSGLLNGHFTADLRLSNITSDGYIQRASSSLQSFYFSTAYLTEKTDLRLNVFSGKEKTYQAWNGVSETDLQSNRTVNYAGTEKEGAPYENETDNYKQDHYQLFFTHRFHPQLMFNTAFFLTHGKGYYEQYKAGEAYEDYGLTAPPQAATTDLVRQLWLDNKFYGNIFSLLYDAGKTQLTLGGALTQYDGNHFGKIIWAANGGVPPDYQWYHNDAGKKDRNVYLKWQQDLGSGLHSFADAQYRYVNYAINGFRDHPALNTTNTYNFFNPKLGLSYTHGAWLAYGSFSIAHKEPNRDDFEAHPLEQPTSEKLNDIELGLEHKNGHASFGLNLYYMKYKDQLVLTGRINDVGAYTRTNLPDSYRAGIELQAAYAPAKWLSAAGNLTLSRNRINNYREYIDDYDNGGQKTNFYKETTISFSPDVIAGVTVTVKPSKTLSLDLLSKYVSSQYLDNTANEQRKLDAYFTQDLRLVYSPAVRSLRSINFIFQVNNVFNQMYEPNGYTFSYFYDNQVNTENYYFPMAGMNWIAGINIAL
jgi:iron complex outermembrane receptor protein